MAILLNIVKSQEYTVRSRFDRASGSYVVDFEGLQFVGQVCHGELNGSVLVNYLHQVVCRLNRCIWYVRTVQKAAAELP